MANVLVEEASLQNIANSIREKTGTTDTYKPSEMASAIAGIVAGGGGGSVQVEAQSYTPADYESAHTFNHSLGVVPDVVMIYAHRNTLAYKDPYSLYFLFALKNGTFSLGDDWQMVQSAFFKGSAITYEGVPIKDLCECIMSTTAKYDITSTSTNANICICNANENTFEFDGTTAGINLATGVQYTIVAISGVSE